MANILAITGSPSHPSRTHGLVEYANTLLRQEGLHTDILSVRDLPAEVLVHGQYNSPALEQPKALLAQADGVIIATPIYKAAYTGVLKAFLDLLPRKPCAVRLCFRLPLEERLPIYWRLNMP